MQTKRPRLALTMGDVAGIGPEVIARALAAPEVAAIAPVVVGHPEILRQALALVGSTRSVVEIDSLGAALPESEAVACFNPGADDVLAAPRGRNDARSGDAAYECLVAATRAALAGEIDGIVTAPLSKAALHLAGHHYPGHTEILAEECGVRDFGMMLYLPRGPVQSPYGLGVVHVTLHTSIRSVPELITTQGVREKIGLCDAFLREMGCAEPRVGVCALNPHAGEEGLFGDEEARLIAPAVKAARAAGIAATGLLPADTLLKRAVAGEFDAVVAMYHDQGHIALKLIGFETAVNVTLGLPIVRTSPSHGTAFDIAWRGEARAAGMIQAIRVAALRVRAR
jgi:4-hydroxythreonine-4-phosphate dehydrogenase